MLNSKGEFFKEKSTKILYPHFERILWLNLESRFKKEKDIDLIA